MYGAVTKVYSPFFQEVEKLRKKRIIFIVSGLLALSIVVGVVTGVIMLVRQMNAITNQLVYLQDTTDIIQSDLGSLQFDIQKTLEEENSMVESYSIDVTDSNFAANSYTVTVTVIPKEYTDQTKAKVFFGTKEYPLILNGYTYQGTITLPTTESYDGNVTFLFQNGEKKSTEVLKNYVGFVSSFENVLLGSMENMPEYSENVLQIRDELQYLLDGAGQFEFSSCMCVVEAEEEVLLEKELLVPEKEPQEDTVDFFPELDEEEISTEVSAGEAVSMEPVSGSSGDYVLAFEEEVLPDTEVRVYLRAVTTEGYVFVYELFQGTTGETEGFTEEEEFIPKAYVIDEKGGILSLNEE